MFESFLRFARVLFGTTKHSRQRRTKVVPVMKTTKLTQSSCYDKSFAVTTDSNIRNEDVFVNRTLSLENNSLIMQHFEQRNIEVDDYDAEVFTCCYCNKEYRGEAAYLVHKVISNLNLFQLHIQILSI